MSRCPKRLVVMSSKCLSTVSKIPVSTKKTTKQTNISFFMKPQTNTLKESTSSVGSNKQGPNGATCLSSTELNSNTSSSRPRLCDINVSSHTDKKLVESKSFVLSSDIATYNEKVRNMKHSEILTLIENVFKPNADYVFPAANGRKFRKEWLKEFKWLCYSPSLDGGLCLPCVLFANNYKHHFQIDVVVDMVKSTQLKNGWTNY